MNPATSTAATATPQRPDALRGDLRRITVAWLFGAFWLSTITGAALTKFQIALGTPDWAFGILAALPFIANFAQLASIYIQGRWGRRKLIFLVTVVFGRLMWAVTAAVPWLLPNHPHLWWKLMAVLLLLSWIGNSAGIPAWIDWMSDVIPSRIRGRYFGVRNRLGQFVGVAATLSIGYIVSMVETADVPGLMLKVTSAILAIAGLIGALDILAFRRVEDHHQATPRTGPTFLVSMRHALADKNFRRFLAFNFTLYLGIGFIGQFIWLYALKEIQLSPWRANLMMVAVPALVYILVYGMWGRLTDKLGKKPVLILSTFVIIHGAWGWILVGHGGMPVTLLGLEFSLLSAIGYAIAVLAMIFWPGYEIANLNVLLSMTGSRDDRRSGTAYVALYSVAVACGGMLSGAIGGTVAAAFEHMRWNIPGLQIDLTYHGLLFLISSVLRTVALCFIFGIEEPRAVATRDAVRFVTLNFYSNAVQTFTIVPGRLLDKAYRMTFRFVPRKPPSL